MQLRHEQKKNPIGDGNQEFLKEVIGNGFFNMNKIKTPIGDGNQRN